MKKLGFATVAVIALVTATAPAMAVQYRFDVVDPAATQNGVPLDNNSYHFFFDSNPTPVASDATSFDLSGSAFYSAAPFGSYRADGTFTFYTTGFFGGLDTPLGNYSGEQLFTGSTSAPTFKLGTFALQDASLTISAIDGNPPAVPEPASWGLMILGFGAAGGALRYRKSKVTTTVAYA